MKKNGKLQGLLRTIGEYALSVGVFIALWWIYVAVKHVPAYILPSPPKVWSSLVKMFVKGTVYAHLWTTTYEVILGFMIGAFLGIVLGYVFIKIDALKTMLMPYLIFLQTAPKIALVPLFVVWFGIGLVSKVVLIISMVLFPVLSGMMLGLESIPPDVRNLMKILKASKWQVFSQVEMQYSLPALFASLKVGIVQAVIGAIVAEWMSGKQGLGYILTYASSTYDTPMLLAGIIVTIILGIATYQVISVLEDKFLYWHESKISAQPAASVKCGVLNKRKILGGNGCEFYIGFITDDEWKSRISSVRLRRSERSYCFRVIRGALPCSRIF